MQSEHNTKLYRSYLEHPTRAVPRPRGKSPQQAAFFTRSPRLTQESAVLASLCCLLGVLPEVARGGGEPGVALGERCQAFEAYRMMVPAAHISFEQLMLLMAAPRRGEELQLALCSGCGALLVVERLAARATHCADCAFEPCALPAPSVARGADTPRRR